MPGPRDTARCSRACEYCRTKKIKCDAQQPCGNCVLYGEVCHTVLVARKSTKERHRALQQRVERAEALLAAAGISYPDERIDDYVYSPKAGNRAPPPAQPSLPPLSSPPDDEGHRNASICTTQTPTAEATFDLDTHRSVMPMMDQGAPIAKPPSIMSSTSHAKGDVPVHSSLHSATLLTGQPPSSQVQMLSPRNAMDENSLHSQEPMVILSPAETNSTAEHHGPESYMSICSDMGVEWVSRKIGLNDFNSSATSLATHVTRSLKLQQRLGRDRKSDPDPETTWKYTKAYFEETPDIQLGIINRSTFELRLRNHIATGTTSEEDPAWYALRNIVYAYGSRFVLYNTVSREAWMNAQNESWQYFENALAVHTELVYFPSDLSTVEALFSMAMFVEGAGAPKLEYMLVSNALRLAQSKGLHLQPSPSCKSQKAEIEHRNWLFWSIYIYEKHIAYRSGRPSAIDDEEITCNFPTVTPSEKVIHLTLFTYLIEHAQISSSTMKSLSRAKARHQSPAQLFNTVDELDGRLQAWWQSIAEEFRPGIPMRRSNLADRFQHENSLYLHCAYNGSLIAIHSMLGYPWNSTAIDTEQSPDIHARMDSSNQIVVEASRNLILATRDINIDSTAPAWLILYYPILGMINLFIHILRFPTLPTVPTDTQLMDMVAAYFGYLDFSTGSQLSIPFTRDIAHWARAASERARAIHPPTKAMTPSQSTAETSSHNELDECFIQLGNLDATDLGSLEDWPSLLPSMSQVPLVAWNDYTWTGQTHMRNY